MLVPAPYQAPKKKAKKKGQAARSGLRRKGTSDATFEDAETHSSPAEDDEEEEESNSPPEGEGRKGQPPRIWRQRRPRRGGSPSWTTLRWKLIAAPSGTPAKSPWPNRKYSKALIHTYIPLLYFVVLMCRIMRCSLAHAHPQQSSSSGNSLDPKVMDSGSPPPASSPKATDGAEVLSRRTFPGRGEVQEAVRALPEGDTSAAAHMGE